MKTVLINSEFNYLVPETKNKVANINGTLMKEFLIASLIDGDNGLENAMCIITNESLNFLATKKLLIKYNPNRKKEFKMTRKEIEKEDLIILK